MKGVLLSLVLCGLLGCEVATKAPTSAEDTARQMYVEAMEELVAGNFQQATMLFQKVSRSPDYVRYAGLARLRIGDALYLQQQYEEAIGAYRSFVAQYGSDPNLPYARYRIASCFFHRIPVGWWILPPQHEKDQTMTRQAVRELKGFLKRFPTSRFAEPARDMLTKARGTLLAHEIYVADYYLQREQWRAAAWRYDEAIERFPTLASSAEIFWSRAESFRQAGDGADAVRSYQAYLESFPEDVHAQEARSALSSLRKPVDESR